MEEIYEALVGLCPTFTLPGPWQSIACDPAFFCLPQDNAAVLADLRQQFADADLIKSGVAKTDETNSLIWHPDLVVEGAPIWAIRPKPDQKPTALIAQMRTVGKNDWAVCTAFQAHRQNDLIAAAGNQVLVVYSMPDLAILQSIGIPVVPGGNWGNLAKGQLNYLCQKLRITSQTPQSNTYGAALRGTAGTESMSLILANWSLATFDLTDSVAAMTTWSHFMELSRYLKLAFDDFGLWKPSSMRLKQLAYQLRYQGIKKVCAGLLNGMEKDAPSMDAHLNKRAPILSIPDAYRAWQQAERNTMNQVGSQKAFELLCELLDRQRFDPLVAEAMQASDPLERNAELALAEVSRLLQPQVLLLTEKIRRSIGEKGTRAGNIISKEELNPVLAQADRLIALTKGIKGWRQNKPTKKALVLKSSEARSKPSVSTPKNSPR